MNNQAAQTMPLPEPYVKGRKEIPGRGKWDIDCGAGPDLYTADQMHQYARDYAAALSQTAGVLADQTHFALSREAMQRFNDLLDGASSKPCLSADASVSERARDE